MSLERLRFLILSLGGIVLTAGALWIVATPRGIGERLFGVFAVLFFGAGTWVTLRAALKGRWWREPKGGQRRMQQLVLPLALLVTLPWPLKLWFCLPLLAAWGALFPQYRHRRALQAAAILAAVLAVAQALVFCISIAGAIRQTHGAGYVALQVSFLLIVLWLDGRVLWEVRKRLREA